MFTGVLIVL